jgi:hypothetical protein
MLAELGDRAAGHERRAIIGVRLSLLGDPRPGVGLRADGLPDILWCKIPGGEITLEEEAGTFAVEPFYIAKYPVTYVQYRAFLEADDGFSNSTWWQGLTIGKADKPGRQFNRRDNHPAENLAWVEAVTFCHWLSERLGYEIRLPTEWEWQQAATGGDPEREYPWPGGWDSRRANTYESELGRSTAVGMYPQGASLTGALDMAGNLWELCRNEYENTGRTDLDGEACRVVRGGSWNNDQANARAAYRNNIHPDNRNNNVGFRLSCLAHIFAPLQRRRSEGVFRLTCCGPAHPFGHGQSFRNWPSITVCGPRRRVEDGAGESRPHGGSSDTPSGIYKTEAPPGREPRGASTFPTVNFDTDSDTDFASYPSSAWVRGSGSSASRAARSPHHSRSTSIHPASPA